MEFWTTVDLVSGRETLIPQLLEAALLQRGADALLVEEQNARILAGIGAGNHPRCQEGAGRIRPAERTLRYPQPHPKERAAKVKASSHPSHNIKVVFRR